jgi:ParB family chromosome partitioning protein
MEKKARLGRGLDALLGLPDNGAETNVTVDQAQVPLDRIDQNPYQPRRTFDEDELSGLSDSIRSHGILQPLVVRLVGDRYQLIAGERRLRAARAVGLASVPVRIVDFNDQKVLEAALVENIQRTDLNPIEKAHGFKDYLERFKMTHEELASRLGLARSTITNLVSLLDLPAEIQDAVRVGQLSTGHAKLLKGIPDRERMVSLAKDIMARGLSVHASDPFIKQSLQEAKQEPKAGPPAEPKPVAEKTAHVQGIEDELRQKLATRVEIRVRGKDRGQIILGFESNDDFERILEVLRK